jgi:hypothetical protein
MLERSLFPPSLKASLALIIAGANVAHAALTTYTVDFSSIPNGTPLSQHDTFFGMLHLSAGENAATLSHTLFLTNEGFFNLGKLYSPAPWHPTNPDPDPPIFFHSYIAASFSYPVTSLEFGTQVFGLWGFSVDFTGVDQYGHPYTQVIDPAEGYQTFDSAAPVGGYLTGFSARWDTDVGPQQLYVDNISFTVDVPEPSTAGLLVLGLAGLMIVRKSVTQAH